MVRRRAQRIRVHLGPCPIGTRPSIILGLSVTTPGYSLIVASIVRRRRVFSHLECGTGVHHIRTVPAQGRCARSGVRGPYLGFCAVWWGFPPGSGLIGPWGSPPFFDSGQVGECAALPSGACFDKRPEMPGELGGFLRAERALQRFSDSRYERVA
jgi:hypothetical protein